VSDFAYRFFSAVAYAHQPIRDTGTCHDIASLARAFMFAAFGVAALIASFRI